MNWNELGLKDGKSGLPQANFETMEKTCTEKGVQVDRPSYLSGYQDGIKSYCTTENGATLGIEGREYLGVCPKDLETAFLSTYNPTFAVYVKKNSALLKSQLSSKEGDLNKIQGDINMKKTGIHYLKGNEKASREREIHNLEFKKREIEHEISTLKKKLARLKVG